MNPRQRVPDHVDPPRWQTVAAWVACTVGLAMAYTGWQSSHAARR
jgi:hypothetical protein